MKEEIQIEKHILVPKHVLLGEEEGKSLLARYNISMSQLPKISKKDPAIKELDIKSGSIVKITRKSATAGESVYFRTVV